MMCRVVATTTALDGAVAFYDFGDGSVTQALTLAFRHGLGAIPMDQSRASALAGEARLAFDLHQRLFGELSAACGLTARVRALPRWGGEG
jgi:heme oxygenase